MLAPSPAALALIQEFEQGPQGGFARVPYLDWAGKQTIGWGHVIRPNERIETPLDAARAEALLAADLARFAPAVAAGLRGVPVTQSMFDALVSLAYNIGIGALLGSTLLAKLLKRDYAGAADQFGRWTRSTNPRTGEKAELPGLVRRRAAERALFLRDGLPE